MTILPLLPSIKTDHLSYPSWTLQVSERLLQGAAPLKQLHGGMTKDRSNVAYFVTRAIDDCDPHRYDESDLHSMEAHGRRMPRIGPGIVYWTKSWVPPLGRRNQDDSTNVLGEGGIGLGRGKGLGIPKVDGGGIGTLSEIVGLASPVDGDVREAIVVQGEAVLLDIVAEPTHREDIKARHVTDDILAIGWGLQVVIEGVFRTARISVAHQLHRPNAGAGMEV